MSQPWYSPQTANHLIWATALVLIALIVLVGLALWLRHQGQTQARKLYAEEQVREAARQTRAEHR